MRPGAAGPGAARRDHRGEALLITPQIERFFAGGVCRLHNHYGPTEAHVVAAYTLAGEPGGWPRRPPIGRPISNVEISVRDTALRPVATGEEGEICIGGIALALGYYGRPDLTAERFVADPATGSRLFRTGDLGRLGPHGFEYSARIDRQVKVRGHRVEPVEVEVVLADHPSVAAAAVTTCMVNGGQELAAFIEPAAKQCGRRPGGGWCEAGAGPRGVGRDLQRTPAA